MPKVKDLIEGLQTHYEPDDILAYSLWSIDDIQSMCDMEDIHLTRDEMEKVLESIHNKTDASIGINWDVVGHHIDKIIGKRKKDVQEIP